MFTGQVVQLFCIFEDLQNITQKKKKKQEPLIYGTKAQVSSCGKLFTKEKSPCSLPFSSLHSTASHTLSCFISSLTSFFVFPQREKEHPYFPESIPVAYYTLYQLCQ